MAYPFNQHPRLLLPPGQLHLNEPADTLFVRAAMELSNNLQVPLDMVLYALASVISTTAQGPYRVRLPNGQIKPLSLAVLIIVASGGRKSTLLKHLLAAILKIEREERQAYHKRLESYEAELAQWEAERDGLLRAMKHQRSKGLPTEEAKQALNEHETLKPTRPRRFRLVFEDTSPSPLFTHLAKGMPSASLITAEGQTLFDSAMLKSVGKICGLNSGDHVTVDRANQPPLELDEVSLGILAMTQPGALQKHLETMGEEAREIGLYARMLVCKPASLNGQRFLDPEAPTPTWDAWRECEARLEALTRENLQLLRAPETEPTIVTFDDEAGSMWVQYHNEIEAEMRPEGRFPHSQDHASKISEITARIAASLHLLIAQDDLITKATLLQAIDLSNWSSMQFHEVFEPLPQVCRDAQLLNVWFQDHRNRNIRFLPRTWVRQRCPNSLRKRDRLLGALDELQAHGQVMQFMDGKTGMLDLMPWMPF
ncbi:YfjI family protein [Halomonas daqiaonensis]|uniref:DUF3987 domain-containing protein n=1 Tax=Halomonas daqiaonensis TaxID=650850 RepID=A0A1H7VB17_9GAMM|nr:YfjI family protein [Halomonas daqiaonensis]SEM06461.1 Protein of unknown function [Halomonas daqiaonensis]